jgi:hypothetical protein
MLTNMSTCFANLRAAFSQTHFSPMYFTDVRCTHARFTFPKTSAIRQPLDLFTQYFSPKNQHLHIGTHVTNPHSVMMPQTLHIFAGPCSAANSLMNVENA